jgi:hypothetical protein
VSLSAGLSLAAGIRGQTAGECHDLGLASGVGGVGRVVGGQPGGAATVTWFIHEEDLDSVRLTPRGGQAIERLTADRVTG